MTFYNKTRGLAVVSGNLIGCPLNYPSLHYLEMHEKMRVEWMYVNPVPRLSVLTREAEEREPGNEVECE